MTSVQTIVCALTALLVLVGSRVNAENARYMAYLNELNNMKDDIGRDIRNYPVFVMTGHHCTKSQDTLAILDQQRIRYKAQDWTKVSGDPYTYLSAIRSRTDGRLELPYIFACGRYFGDHDDLERYVKNGWMGSFANC